MCTLLLFSESPPPHSLSSFRGGIFGVVLGTCLGGFSLHLGLAGATQLGKGGRSCWPLVLVAMPTAERSFRRHVGCLHLQAVRWCTTMSKTKTAATCEVGMLPTFCLLGIARNIRGAVHIGLCVSRDGVFAGIGRLPYSSLFHLPLC